jgi:anti-anti-sigma regulatory factor
MEDAFLAALGENRDTERLVIYLDGVGRIDTTAAFALRSLIDDARNPGLLVELADVRPRWRRFVEGVIESERDPLSA